MNPRSTAKLTTGQVRIMNKELRKILIISIAISGTSFLLVNSAQAQENLVVEFENTPLFSETNFLPGQEVTRWVKVTNNSGETQRIATEAINENDPNNFASQLNLTIEEGATVIFNNTLAQFFSQGETYLSSLANGGAQTQYDFTIAFNSGSGNDYQGKSLGFDILVGFEGTEGGLSLPPPGGGTGGGLPPGLSILDELVRVTTTTETSVTIIWTTSYFSTSQVIYAREGEFHTLDLTDNIGTPPKYGYASTTPEYNVSSKVTAHLVTITGLISGTTYYYRVVSHASLAISQEHSFTTLGVKVEEKVEEEIEEIPLGEKMLAEEEIPAEEVVLAPTGEEEVEKPEEFITEGAAPAEEGIVTVPPEERAPGGGLASLFLASVGEIRETAWMTILVTLCLIGLVVIGIRERELAQKRRKVRS